MKVMLERFYFFANSSKAPIYPELDNSSRPDLHDGSWTFWKDNPLMPETNTNFIYPDPMADLKLHDHWGSSAPYVPADNEKIFKENAKKFANFTTHPHPENRTTPPDHKLSPPEHQSYNISSPTVEKVEPTVVIEGIGSLIQPKENPIIPTEAPYVPLKGTEPPSIDIQNVFMDGEGSGQVLTTTPSPSYMSPTKASTPEHFKPISLGEVISGKPGENAAVDKTLGTKLHSNEIKIDLPQVYDVIDETDNPPVSQSPKEQTVISNVYDVIDMKKGPTKATSNINGTLAGIETKPEKKPAIKKPQQGVPPPKKTPPARAPSPLSTFFKPKPQTVAGMHPTLHKFSGDIVMDGHKFHVEGTETGDNAWLMKDLTSG